MKVLKVATAMALATACGPQTASDNVVQRYEIQTSALSTYNGVSYNGISYGGFSLRYASGLGPNGTSLYDTDAVHLQSTLLTAIESELDLTEPTQLQLSGALEDGRNVDLRIDDVQVREDGRNSYLVSIGAGGEWTSLCGLDEDGVARRAITVPGFWNTKSGAFGGGSWSSGRKAFSFACRDSSIEKCVRLGYGPEDRDFFGRPHRLLACVRMLRADYCGDGRSWTTDGRLVEAWDNAGINARTEPDWPREAAWTPEGATCLDHPRLLFPNESATPFCLDRLNYISCSSRYAVASIWSSFFLEDSEKE